MKKTKWKLLLILLILISSVAMAQLQIPQLSPAAKVEQQIGLAKVTINYSRPSLRGRKLLGKNDIPFGKVWRMGANDITTVDLSKDLLIDVKKITKGIYAFVAIPDSVDWTIILNSDAKQWGVYGYKESKDVIRFKVKVDVLKTTVETLSFTFENIQPLSADVVFAWENVKFKLTIEHDCDSEVMEDIARKTSASNVSMMTKMEAAEYYLMKNHELEQALIWSEEVLAKTKSPFRFNLKAQIAQKLGKCELAKEAAKSAIEYAQKNGDAAAIALAEGVIKNCK